MTTSFAQVHSVVALPTRDRRLRRSAAVLGAVLLTSLLWMLGSAAGADYVITDSTGTAVVSWDVVAVFSGGFALLGWAVLAVLERVTRRATTIWTVLALAVLVLAEVPVVLVEATTATAIALTVIHAAVAVVVVPVLRGTARRS